MNQIILTPHNENWPHLFNDEKLQLQNLLSDIIVGIVHIGSTAIPGIYAKPIIDIMIGVNNIHEVNQTHISRIQSLGYQYIKQYEKDLPYRRFFQKENISGHRTHHIHLVNYRSAWWERHVLFRDYLNKYPVDAKSYESLKLQLSHSASDYINAHPTLLREAQRMKKLLGENFTMGNQYALAKSILVETILKKAYFDFTVHPPNVALNRLYGYIPQISCFDIYKEMFQEPEFVNCFGIRLNDNEIKKILERDINYWETYGFGPYDWFEKKEHDFVGEGGLNHTTIHHIEEIELTYSLKKNHWGKGYATEISQFAIEDAFNPLNLNHIVCFTTKNNHRSLNVIKKLGFQYEKDFMHYNLMHQLYRLHRN